MSISPFGQGLTKALASVDDASPAFRDSAASVVPLFFNPARISAGCQSGLVTFYPLIFQCRPSVTLLAYHLTNVTNSPWSDKQQSAMLICMKIPNPIKSTFGQQVKKLRLESGLSQETFADKCGMDRTYISGIERSVRNPTLEVINAIAEGLEINLKDLFDF